MTDYTHDIERYLTGKMSSAEKFAFEKKALDDPFLAEALEGAEQLGATEFVFDIKSLNSRILPQQENKNSWFMWPLRIAAGLILLSVSTYLIWTFSQSLENSAPIALENTGEDKLPIEEPATLSAKAQDSLQKPSEVQDRVSAARPTPSPDKSSSTATHESEPETTALKEDELLNQPVITQLHPPGAPFKSNIQPEEQATKAEIEKPVSAVSRDETDKSLRKKAISEVSGVANSGKQVITGKVTSSEDGSPLPGINVIIKGSTLGTITDGSGKYQLDFTEGQPTLVFSFIGLRSVEINTDAQKELDVQMSLDVAQLSEVVVVGYSVDQGAMPPTVNLAHPETGNKAYKQYIETSIVYPTEALTRKTEGRVTVEFMIETNGALTDFTILRGIGSGCDEELIRLIREGPKWNPTRKDGIPIRDKARVRLRFTLPK
jgi:TonB family protein